MRDVPWLEPYPDRLLAEAAPAEEEPHAAVVAQETITLAFLAVLQLLPPRQRASPGPAGRPRLAGGGGGRAARALRARGEQRAAAGPGHATDGAAGRPARAVVGDRRAAVDEDVLARYIAAYEAADVDTTLALLADDIRVTMPPAPYLFEGREAVLGLAYRARATGEWRLRAHPGQPPAGRGLLPAVAGGRRVPGVQDRRARAGRRRDHPRDHDVRSQALRHVRPAGRAAMTVHPPAVPVPAFLGSRDRPLPHRVARELHIVPPGERLDCPETPWADALAMLEGGCVELRGPSGGRLHLCRGAIFSLRGLTPAVVTSAGPDPAVIHTLHRRTEGEVP